MNKLVNWGHWLVAAVFGLGGVLLLAGSVPRLVHALIRGQWPEWVSSYPIYTGILSSILLLLCSWGILTWRRWGHHLALFYSTANIVVIVVAIFFASGPKFGFELVGAMSLLASVTVWLLLPAVWAKYARRVQMA